MSRKFDQICHAPKPASILKSAALILASGLFFADPLDMQAAVFLGGPFTLTDPASGTLTPQVTATPYPGNIVVANLATIPLTGSNVTLTINSFARSGRPDDLDMLLVGPTGASLIVWSDVGGTGGATGTLTITLSDLGASFLPDGGPLASGTFKPTNEVPLGVTENPFPAPAPAGPYGNPGGLTLGAGPDTFATEFNGTNPNGTWSLYILDDTPNSGGETTTIGGWSLDINATVPSTLATWLNAPASADWNTGTNWLGGIAPVNPGDTATFNTSTNTSPTLSANVTIDSITFNPGASPFTVQTNGRVLTLLGVGIVNNSGNVQTINNNNSTSGGAILIGGTIFTNAATADSTVITNSGVGTSTQFFNSSTAGNATITNSGAGSFTAFTQGASGGNAALINANPTAFITIAELNGAGTTAGSIAGNGTIFLGSKNLTVGGNQQSTVFSGVISDGESSNLPPSLATQQPSYVGGSLTKVGTGTLTLTGINTYTGGTNLNGGILAVNSDVNLGTGALSFNGGTLEALGSGVGITSIKPVSLAAGGGTFLADAGTASTLSGAITGVGAWTKSGPGTLTLTGVNTYSGGTNLNGGILAVNSDVNLGTGALSFNGGTLQALVAGSGIDSSKAVNLAVGGGTFLADAGTASTLSGTITGVGAWTKAGPGTLTLTGANTYSGGTTVSAGTLQLGAGGTTGSITGNVANNGNLAFNRSDVVTFGGVISGTGSVQQNGTGTTVLTGDNTYTGGTIIEEGTLQLGNGGTSGSVLGNIVDNGILAFNRSDSFTFSGVISGSGIVQQNGTGTTVLLGANTYAGGTHLNAGILAVNSDLNLGSGPLSFNGGTLEAVGAGGGITSSKGVNLAAGGGTFLADAGTTSTLSGLITGVGAWTKTGLGTLTLTGVNTYSGGTNLNGGILAVNSDVNLGIGALSFNGGTLQAGGGIDSSKAVNLAVGGGTFLADAGTASTLSGAITGVGAWAKSGSGTLTLTGVNIYSGGTNLDGGILAVNSDVNLGTGALSFNGGTLQALVAGGGIDSSKAVNLAVGGGTFLADAGTASTLSGTITGVGAWTKAGPGTLTLTGANTYSGGTTIAGGTIVTQNASALGTGPVAFGSGTALQVQSLLNVNGNWTVFPGSASVSGGTVQTFGDFNLGGGGTLIANASFNIPGAANINSSGLVVKSAFTVNDNVNLGGSSAAIVNGVLTSASVNVNDASSLVVSNSGTVAAPVNVGPSALLGLFGRINGSVINAGFFQGTGVVNGNVFNSGIVSPGTSIGTLTINGNYTQSASGTLRIEVAGASPGQYDVLVVNGRASLAGRLQLLRIGGFRPRIGDQLAFLATSGGVSGTFNTVENDFLATGSIVVFDVIYLPNAVLLEAVQGSFAEFVSIFVGTRNALAVGKALDSAVGDPRAAEPIGFLNNQTLTDLREDILLISPEQLTSIFVIGVSLANVQTANLERRLDDIRAGSSGFSSAGFAISGSEPSFQEGFAKGSGPEGKSGPAVFAPAPENRWGIFATGLGEFTNVDNAFNARGYDLATGGFTMGIDYRIGSHFAIGLTGGYVYTHADLFNGGRIKVNGGKLGLYGTAFGSGFYLDTAVVGGLSGYDTRRTALGGSASGETLGGDLNVLVAGGYDWKKGGLTIGPTASFQYTLVGFGDFTENGSLAPLAYPNQNAESLRTALGMRAFYEWKIGSIRLIPELRLAWQHEFGETDYALVSSFASGAGNSFTVRGPAIGRDSMLLGAGFAIHWNDRFSTYAYYDGELFRTNYLSNNVSAGFRLTF